MIAPACAGMGECVGGIRVFAPLRRAGFRAGLREHLLVMVLVAMLPLGLFSILLLVQSWRLQQDDVRETVLDAAQSLATTVRSELDGSVRKLELVALSEALDRNAIAEFRAFAGEVLAASPEWSNLVLVSLSGEQLVNMRQPPGIPLPTSGDRDFQRRAVDTRRPAVSDLFQARSLGEQVIAVAVPVIRDGRVLYTLSASLSFGRFQTLLGTAADTTGIAAVMDGGNRFVWRSRDPVEYRGKPPVAAVSAAMQRANSGTAQITTYEGEVMNGAWAPVPGTSWRTFYGVAAAPMESLLRRQLALMTIGWAMCALLGMALAAALGRRLGGLMDRASQAAERASVGKPVAPLESTVREMEALGAALREASMHVQHEAAARAAAAAAHAQLLAVEQAARSRAEADNRAKDEFLAMLGHELRNPLAAIMNAAQVVKRLPGDAPEAQAANAVIARQADHLRRIIDDLLDLTRVVTGKITLERAPLDLAAHVRHVVATLDTAGRTQRHVVAVEAASVWIGGDATRVEQIVTNLVGNALTYTPAGGHVTVRVGREGDTAVLAVTDDGEGIDAAALPHLFDLFFQADQTLGRARGGLGIGLTLVRRLTELHGGTVEAQSAGRGCGSTFIARFPACEAPAATSARASAAPVLSRRVLIIEDNDDARRTLRALLELKGHVVADAPDGPSGLLAARSFRPEIALVDIGMPGMNGYEVAAALRAEHGDAVRLTALSGYGLPDHRRRAFEAGFEQHLVKPVEADALDRVLTTPVSRAA
jgi:signal transduction histidine kinase